MRSIILSLVLGAVALGGVALTPGQADATWRRGYYRGFYPTYPVYGGYNRAFYPRYTYYAPGYSAFYSPVYRPYTPAWNYYGGPYVYTSPNVVYYPRVW